MLEADREAARRGIVYMLTGFFMAKKIVLDISDRRDGGINR
jgi:hypothetical protein